MCEKCPNIDQKTPLEAEKKPLSSLSLDKLAQLGKNCRIDVSEII
jgi:hypothetical protein